MLRWITLLAAFYSAAAWGQCTSWPLKKARTVQYVSVDQLGNFYFVYADGRIQQRDKDGKPLREVCLQPDSIALFEAWNPNGLFAYHSQTGACTIMSHKLEILYRFPLSIALTAPPQLMCPEGNGRAVWLLDNEEYAIKKIGLDPPEVKTSAPLPQDWLCSGASVSFMRAYQDRVFLLDPSQGILVFNAVGAPVVQIEAPGVSFFDFLGSELYYTQGGKTYFVDLYTFKRRAVAPPHSIKKPVFYVLITDERWVTVTKDRAVFCPINL